MLGARPLWPRFLLYVVVLALSIAAVVILILGRLFIDAAHDKAALLADAAEDLATWSAQQNGLWARSERSDASDVGEYLDEVPLVRRDASRLHANSLVGPQAFDELRQAGLIAGGFHRKHPMSIGREVHEVMERHGRTSSWSFVASTATTTRTTAFDTDALRLFHDSPAETSTYRVMGNTLHYARKVSGGASCSACHDTWARRTGGGGAPVIKEGQLMGIYSVTVPVIDLSAGRRLGVLTTVEWCAIAAALASFASVVLFVRRQVIGPLGRLVANADTASTTDISVVQLSALQIEAHEENSTSELDRLSVAIKRLLRSIEMLRRSR
jgi:Protein of unknown function (DUF3365)